MPPKRLHKQFDNDTGEGTLNIKKIQIVLEVEDGDSENDSDEEIKKIRFVRVGDDDDEGIMCENCCQVLHSAALLARHKEMVQGSERNIVSVRLIL